MVYNVFIGLAIAVVASIIIVGLLCIMIIAGENDKNEYRCKKTNKKGKK